MLYLERDGFTAYKSPMLAFYFPSENGFASLHWASLNPSTGQYFFNHSLFGEVFFDELSDITDFVSSLSLSYHAKTWGEFNVMTSLNDNHASWSTASIEQELLIHNSPYFLVAVA
jgi:hypothetical protein